VYCAAGAPNDGSSILRRGLRPMAKLKAMPAWKTYEMTAGHDAMVDQPDRLTEILLEVA